MPRRSEISTNLSNELISVALYEQNHFEAFSPSKEFVRWATVEVIDFSDVPHGMETLILPAGKYAVFDYKGTPRWYSPLLSIHFNGMVTKFYLRVRPPTKVPAPKTIAT